MPTPPLIAIGASAGGVEALRTVVSGFPRPFEAAVILVLHVPPYRDSFLPAILARAAALPVRRPKDGEKVRSGQIYVASPDSHLIVAEGRLRVVRGPRENGHRPAIDPLFRSVSCYGKFAAGVILSGTMDDGSAGLFAIKKAGGVAIVQDPKEAAFADMPRNAIENVNVDRILPSAQIASELLAWTRRLTSKNGRVRQNAAHVQRVPPAKRPLPITITEDGSARKKGPPSAFTCPECKGTLWEDVKGRTDRFVCRVGHSYTLNALEAHKTDDLEASLWMCVRTLEERADLQQRLAVQSQERHQAPLAESFRARARVSRAHANTLRSLLGKEGQVVAPRRGGDS